MGVNLSGIVPVENLSLEDLSGKAVAIDAYNAIYQFLSTIRGPDGTPLKDASGRVTSHLAGLLYRNVNLLEAGIKPIYVFDGVPHELKSQTLAERSERRSKAQQEWEEAITEGDIERARCKATQSSRMTNEIAESSRILLTYLGIPIVQAPEEGEAQAAYMASTGQVWAASSQDFDSLLFGAPRLVRNLNITGRRKMPGSKVYRDISIELIELSKVLEANGLRSREQLIDLAILMGTDYNQGIRGIGPKKGLKLIQQHGDLDGALRALGESIPQAECVQDIFLRSEKVDVQDMEWRSPDREKILDYLSDEHGFSEKRVLSALDRLDGRKRPSKKAEMPRSQVSLDRWV
ncbi:MAG: flap endonuclease-1 [Methanomassiliicoccaceae archaeon]|jgi:flap endonuclease-1|nr:flap endonuclease-1 [Euryarchaeota archaeon]HOB37438.1 flap endonuclease-1 [Methanomassiliicoccaceae archaeon]HOQ25993.1 flap endonuclease-1 [Methanomassiliicoccaceae archaeon]HQA21599.1 flap endonuclease-1 [Methanomassiliicoccaceae archaeon]HQD87785.1 flap endonuclease-1 [Methanomassiliicoccaceae archaeon]